MSLERGEEFSQIFWRIDSQVRGQDHRPRGGGLCGDFRVGREHGQVQTLGLFPRREEKRLPEAAPGALEGQRVEFFVAFDQRAGRIRPVGAQASEVIDQHDGEQHQQLQAR